ncbi:microcin B17-processing protein McbD [Pseudomonas azotoformans]|uniref:Microcin B17-processing protein McbD n=1 Tax=Pseudomonas azotoformans TaxID=47878 RepID=A0A1V2J460_PSEAZ|nr:YcaO-like family protein [Pseudomonas azotoformans]OIN45833.1 microcin B17-processing protein McbD [Pseudomonas azotoformans]ONH40213.1 microcin B17-processing protein McbD [Pseudomonas azotoformans]SDN50575.1 YcaO-like family protein [Pseudomonas azotoformans]
MKLINGMHNPDLPGIILFQPAGILGLPSSVEISDFLSVNGSGVGGGSNSIKTATGEYFERRHFYREVLAKERGCLSESLSGSESLGFAEAFIQTANKKTTLAEVSAHRFALSQVARASDFSTCFIPTVCISLSSHSVGDDNVFYPLRDTCGCSFHWCPNTAFLGAIKEYLERQFLIRFWLTKMCRSLIPATEARKLLASREVRHLYGLLSMSGDITFLDISDSRFPGCCILVVYGQERNDRHVNYCAGMAYSSNMTLALEKSLLELWQTFRFMNVFKATNSDEEKLEDSYIRYFLSCNAYETYLETVNVLECGGVGSIQDFTLPEFLLVLKQLDIAGYFYSRLEEINGVAGVFVKFVSPDLFLHMNNSQNFNLINKYSKEFESSILSTRLGVMVPFP